MYNMSERRKPTTKQFQDTYTINILQLYDFQRMGSKRGSVVQSPWRESEGPEVWRCVVALAHNKNVKCGPLSKDFYYSLYCIVHNAYSVSIVFFAGPPAAPACSRVGDV